MATLIRVDATTERVARFPTLEELRAAIECGCIDGCRTTAGLFLYVDDEGMLNGSPFNLFASSMAGCPLFGNAVLMDPAETAWDKGYCPACGTFMDGDRCECGWSVEEARSCR